MREKEIMNNKVVNIILAFIASVALCLDYKTIYLTDFPVGKPFRVELFTMSLITFALIALYLKVKEEKLHILKKILCMIFSIFMVLGNSFYRMNSLELVIGSKRMMMISVIVLIGYYYFFKRLYVILDKFINNFRMKDLKEEGIIGRIVSFIDKKPFLASLIIILICWAIYAIAFYPIILSPDPSFQIRQFFNVHTKYADWVIQLDPNVNMTNHHPVLHTLLLGECLSLGRKILNDNFGLFIYSAIQMLVLSSVLSYTIVYLKKIKVSSKARAIILFIYALLPVFPFYAMSGVKDTLYTSFVILYVIILFNFVKYKKDESISIGHAIGIYIVLLLIALFRNNGLYVIVLSFPILILYSRKNRIKSSVIFLAFICSFMCYSKVILPYYKISDGSIREALTIPFQQTARYVREHEEDLSEEDKKAIDTILGYDDLAARYNPELSDPVKNNYNKYATNDDLNAYFKVWFKGLIKHPVTYIEATMNNIYGYFYPNKTKWYIYHEFDARVTKDNLVDYSYNSLEGLRTLLIQFGVAFPYIPVIGMICNIGINTWLLLIMGVHLIIKKKKEYLIALLPGYITVLICMASPVNAYFRYSMPYIFAMPTLIAMFFNIINEHR